MAQAVNDPANYMSIDQPTDVVHTFDDALAAVGEDKTDETFVIGGGEIYQLALPRADRVLLTRVHADVDGDAFFPPLNAAEWTCSARERNAADERHAFAFTFETWERR